MNTYNIVYLLCGIFRAYTVYLMMELFFTSSKYARKNELLVYILHYVIISMTYLILDVPILNVVANLGALYLVTLCYESTIKKRIFSSGVIFLVLVTVETIAVVCLDTMKHSIWENMDSESIAALILTQILTFMAAMLLRIIGRKHLEVSMEGRSGLALMIIPAFTIFEIVLLYSGMELREGTAVLNMALALIVNFIVFYLYEQLGNVIRMKYEKKTAEEQNRFYELQINLMQEHNERVRSIRHDMNNNLNVLQGLVNRNEIDETKTYLQQLLNSPGLEKDAVRSGNAVFDSILNYKIRIAKEKQITIKADIYIPKDVHPDSIAWVTILGNLLDNAIEAAEQVRENPYIDLQITYNKRNLILTIKNSYNGIIKEENGRFHTTKKDSDSHGIGMENVRRAIGERGDLDINYTEKEFSVEVSMTI